MIEVIFEFSNITAAGTQDYLKGIAFNATAGKNNYTIADIAELSRMVGKALFKVEMDGSNLINGGSVLATWDDTNFTISAFINVLGGERITIIYI